MNRHDRLTLYKRTNVAVFPPSSDIEVSLPSPPDIAD